MTKKELIAFFENCNICPHNCNINRFKQLGVCRAPVIYKNNTLYFKLNLYQPFFHEEPVITPPSGSGNIFFSHCNLKCIYCQNFEISHNGNGYLVSLERFIEIIITLYQKGCYYINFVSPTHYAPIIIYAAKKIKKQYPDIKFIYNTNAYDNVETIKNMKDIIDIYLPDFKYGYDSIAQKYSNIKNYKNTAIKAIKQMIINTEKIIIKEKMLQKGVIIRHLILPSNIKNSLKVIFLINKYFQKNILLSLMSQYIPYGNSQKFPEINKKLQKEEYLIAYKYSFEKHEFDGFFQDLDSATDDYIPDFIK